MRILLVNAHGADAGFGGTEKHLARLARLLPRRGWQVRLLAAFPPQGTTTPADVTLHERHWRGSRWRRLANHVGDGLSLPSRRLDRVLVAAEPDVVHTHNLPGITTAVWEVARRRGIPVVHTLHDYHLLCPRVTLTRRDGRPCCPHAPLCAARRRSMLRHAGGVTEVIAVSTHLQARHRGAFPSAGAHVIRNPFEPVAGVVRPPAPDRPVVIGYMGALEPIKGVDRLLDAAPGLARLGCALHIAGDGRLAGRARELAESLTSVQFRGRVDGAERAAFLSDCDLGIVPSVWEEPGGPPNVVLEWLSIGRPVLASARGGLEEALRRLPGALPISTEPDAICAAVQRLCAPAAWTAARAAADVDVDAVDDEARWIDEHVAVYAQAAGRRGA